MEETAATVTAIEDAGPDSFALVFETPNGFDAEPGQFVKCTIDIDGETHSRFYSISSPRVGETFELTIEIDPDGEVSPRLRSLEAGDELILSGPYGNAHYEGESRVLVVAGGPGIGPAVGIAERTIDDSGDAAVIYRDDDPLHVDRLDALDSAGANITVLADEESVRPAIETVDLTDRQVFIYGFADFLDDATAGLAAAGGEPDQAKVENFG